jgi:hypothetical protein
MPRYAFPVVPSLLSQERQPLPFPALDIYSIGKLNYPSMVLRKDASPLNILVSYE